MNNIGRNVQPSALHPSPDLQRRDLPAIDMCFISGNSPSSAEPQSGIAEFAIMTPEVRCRVRGELIFVPATYPFGSSALVSVVDRFWPSGGVANADASLFGATALWLAKRSEDTNGGGQRVPVENLVGSIYAQRKFPDPGCLGFNFEAETCVDEIFGRVAFDAKWFNAFAGKWVLRPSVVAYQPLTDVEWNRVLGKFAMRALATCRLSGTQQE